MHTLPLFPVARNVAAMDSPRAARGCRPGLQLLSEPAARCSQADRVARQHEIIVDVPLRIPGCRRRHDCPPAHGGCANRRAAGGAGQLREHREPGEDRCGAERDDIRPVNIQVSDSANQSTQLAVDRGTSAELPTCASRSRCRRTRPAPGTLARLRIRWSSLSIRLRQNIPSSIRRNCRRRSLHRCTGRRRRVRPRAREHQSTIQGSRAG